MAPAWKTADSLQRLSLPGSDLATFVTGLDFDEIPLNVAHQAKRVLLEGISWLFLGSRREEASPIHQLVLASGSPGGSTVVGLDERVSPAHAALANGAIAQIQDCSDGFRVASVYGAAYHPGRVVIPAALAVCEERHLTGRDLLSAVVVGYDVAGRIRGLDPRPPASAYAAAAVAARLDSLTPGETLNAMGIAGHLASPIPGADPYDVTFLTVGYLARIGVEAATLAGHGLTGPPLGGDPRLSKRLAGDGLGEEFEITNIYMKPYVGCRLLHGAIDAALELRQTSGFDWRRIDQVRVRVIPEAEYVTGHTEPDSYYRTCQLSLPYSMACALIDGELGERQFTTGRIASTDVHELQRRIDAVVDETLGSTYPEGGRPTVVELCLEGGDRLRWEGGHDRGEPENPLTDQELVDKFHAWAGPSLDASTADELVSTVWAVDSLDDLSPLSKLLAVA